MSVYDVRRLRIRFFICPNVVAASPSKRARIIGRAVAGLARVAQDVAAEAERNPAFASATVVAQLAKRDGPAKECHLRGAEAAAKERAQREGKVCQSVLTPREVPAASDLKSGILLMRNLDATARAKAMLLRYQVTHDDLVVFVSKVVRQFAQQQKHTWCWRPTFGWIMLSPRNFRLPPWELSWRPRKI